MLPPVAALSDAFLGSFSQSHHTSTDARVQIGASVKEAVAPARTLPVQLSGERSSLLSLSGQLQLSQGLSVVAETLGAILKVERHKGEALTDYAQRLGEVIAALSPSERVALQKALNQMMKGTTLRLLTDILKNPVGPEATRLALQLETEAYLVREPLTKQVVTSYRQNGGHDLPPAVPAKPTILLELAKSLSTQTGRVALQTSTAANSSLAPTQPGLDGTMSKVNGETLSAFVETARLAQAIKAALKLTGETSSWPTSPGQPKTLDAPLTQASARTQAASGSERPAFDTRPAAQRESLPHDATSAAGGKSAARLPASATASLLRSAPQDRAPDDVTYDGPALARMGSRIDTATLTHKTPDGTPATAKAEAAMAARLAEAQLIGVTVEEIGSADSWLADIYALEGQDTALVAEAALIAGGDIPEQAVSSEPPGARLAGALSEQQERDVLSANQSPADAMQDDQPGLTTGSTPLEAEEAAHLQSVTGRATESPAALLASAAQAGLTARSMARDPIGPIFVPYPPQGGYEEDEKDLIEAVEASDEDGARNRNGGRRQGGGDTGQDDEDGADEGDMFAPANAGGMTEQASDSLETKASRLAAGSNDAEAYYQRMAGW
ncbi:hypothetical protein [Rhizobium sp. FY34]|uniref:hypothetical protein n=1 Tax=Rhizobium sp. FY34 TaxID=2562309 RepID=UPI0010BF6DBD|nr:hypothetical protein [Rhizobium sp. FY34]